jgi:hypothetical protein
MEDMLCAMALKSANCRQIQHTQAGLLVFCERALKSVGERTPHTGGRCRCGGLRETARAREVTLRSVWRAEALHDIDGGDLAAGGSPPAGELLTGNIGSLCEWQPLKALRAPCGPIPQYKILYYCASGF